METKQTAVEWLVEQVNLSEYQKAFGQTYISIELIEQAQKMEKEEIINAYDEGYDIRDDLGSLSTNPKGEQYYNEIYGQNILGD